MVSASLSRQHWQLFLIAMRSATTQASLERAIDTHSRHMTPADHANARSVLAKRLAELSPTHPVGATSVAHPASRSTTTKDLS